MAGGIVGAGVDRVGAYVSGRGAALARRLGRTGSTALLCACALFGHLAPLPAQSMPARAWFADTYDRLEIRATDDELDRLAELWRWAADGDRSLDDRRAALRDLFETMLEIQDAPDWRYSDQALTTLVDRAGELEGRPSPPALVPPNPASRGLAGAIEVIGGGPCLSC